LCSGSSRLIPADLAQARKPVEEFRQVSGDKTFFITRRIGAKMKIVVIGPGALGCLIAASISVKRNPAADGDQGRHDEIWLLDHNRDRAALLADKGLILEENGRQSHCAVNATADPAAIGSADLIMLCVKSGNVQAGLKSAAPLATPGSLLVSLQNGISHLPQLYSTSLAAAIAIGVTAQGATLVAPGHVRHAGRGITRLGFVKQQPRPVAAKLKKTAALLAAADLETVITDNIIKHVWAKLFINVGINALTAILRCKNGQLLEISDAKKKLISAVREAESVARAMGIIIDDDPVAATLGVCRATSRNLSSMLQDVIKKRPTEIAAINGAIVIEAHRLGIPAPANEELLRQVKEIEQSYYTSEEQPIMNITDRPNP